MASWNPIGSLLHIVDRGDPHYIKMQDAMKNGAIMIQWVSGIGLVVSAVRFFFGIAQNNISSVFLSGALAYVCYNMYRVGENYFEIAKAPNSYRTINDVSGLLDGEVTKINEKKVKTQLKKNTFYFGAFVDFLVQNVLNSQS
jgi:hypothetical protein